MPIFADHADPTAAVDLTAFKEQLFALCAQTLEIYDGERWCAPSKADIATIVQLFEQRLQADHEEDDISADMLFAGDGAPVLVLKRNRIPLARMPAGTRPVPHRL